MIKTPLIRSVLSLAIGLLAALTLGGTMVMDGGFGLGVLMGGVVMVLSFLMGGRTVQRVSEAVEAGRTGGAAGVAMIKLPLLVLAVWMLLERFDPMAVALGGSVVVVAVVLVASAEALRAAPKEA